VAVRRRALSRCCERSFGSVLDGCRTYRLRHGDSIALDDTEIELLELSLSAVRGIAVPDIVFDIARAEC
jgi:hypothetical protein